MITQADVAHWRAHVPWISPEDVEQDLVLSRLIIEVANHPLLGEELLLRGGTCLHKLWLDKPWRYSEDLDYVRRSQGGVGEVLDAIREVATDSGFDEVRTQISMHPKARLRSTFAGGRPLRIKVDINTFERFPARPTVTRDFGIDSPWFSGSARVPTFALEELTATKIRALFQRNKGRDLFDLWLAVHYGGAVPVDIAHCFDRYRPEGWTVRRALANLDAKLDRYDFRSDLDPLLAEWPADYTIEEGGRIARTLINAITATES